MKWSTDPTKNVLKKITTTRKKIFRDKSVQSKILWLNLNKIDKYFAISG